MFLSQQDDKFSRVARENRGGEQGSGGVSTESEAGECSTRVIDAEELNRDRLKNALLTATLNW